MVLLGAWYRARHSFGYRLREEKQIGASIDWNTGLPLSEADLLPAGQSLMGPGFVLRSPVMPDSLAANCLLREESDGTTTPLADARAVGLLVVVPDLTQAPVGNGIPATKEVIVCRKHPRERASVEAEFERIEREQPTCLPVIKDLCGREAWEDDEAVAVSEMTYLWQKTMMDFERKGWLRLTPPEVFISQEGEHYNRDLYHRGVGDDGLPWIGTVTPEGLDEAERRIPGTPLARGPFWGVSHASIEKRSRVIATSPWAAERAKSDAAGAV